MKKRLIFLVTIFLVSAVALGCLTTKKEEQKSVTPAQNKELRLITVFGANAIDAHRCYTSFIFNSGTVETLVGLNGETGELYPWLAESWTTVDGQNWLFKIRPGVKFHNGKDLTPEAVKLSLEHSIDVNPGMRVALNIRAIEVEGEFLKIETRTVYPALTSELAHFNTAIVDMTEPENQPPIGTGAFKFQAFDPAKEAVVVRFDQYWNGTAKLAKVTIQYNENANSRMLALQSGDADIVYKPASEVLDILREDKRFIVESVPGKRIHHLIFNYAGKNRRLWENEEFRKGIDALVDRKAIVANVMNDAGVVAYNPFPTKFTAFKEHVYSQEVALQHFAAAGLVVKDGKVTDANGNPIKLLMATYNARPELPQIAQVVQASAKQIGLEIEIYIADNIDEFLQNGDWDLVTYSSLSFSRGDGSFFLNAAFAPKGVQNSGKLDDEELNNLLTTYNQTLDIAQRDELTKQIIALVENKAYNCYIAAPNETAAYYKAVKGWVTPSNELEFQMVTKDLDIITQ